MAEWEWDELDELMKIIVDTEASRDEHFDLAVVKVNEILLSVEIITHGDEKTLERFIRNPDRFILYDIYSDNDE